MEDSCNTKRALPLTNECNDDWLLQKGTKRDEEGVVHVNSRNLWYLMDYSWQTETFASGNRVAWKSRPSKNRLHEASRGYTKMNEGPDSKVQFPILSIASWFKNSFVDHSIGQEKTRESIDKIQGNRDRHRWPTFTQLMLARMSRLISLSSFGSVHIFLPFLIRRTNFPFHFYSPSFHFIPPVFLLFHSFPPF